MSFVFSTATQPAFRQGFNFKNGFSDDELKEMEITENTDEIFRKLNRVKYEFKEFQKPQTWTEIAAEMLAEKQILCVVNTRKHAFELRDEIIRQKMLEDFSYTGAGELFHLSSAMCAEHRLEKIAEIKKRLENGETCRVVSTQLVEAGVDLDFPVLFRAIAPLDSIVQAAGRCNREGKLKDSKGNIKKGRVKVFTPVDEGLPKGIYKQGVKISRDKLPKITSEELACNKTFHNETIFENYFSILYEETDTGKEIERERKKRNFRKVSEKAKVIDDSGTPVIVKFKDKTGDADSFDIINQIREEYSEKFYASRIDIKMWIRKLQRFMVNVRKDDFEKLQLSEKLEKLVPNKDLELFVLKEKEFENDSGYDENLGLVVKGLSSEDFIC